MDVRNISLVARLQSRRFLLLAFFVLILPTVVFGQTIPGSKIIPSNKVVPNDSAVATHTVEFGSGSQYGSAYTHKTPNFIVTTSSAAMAKEFAEKAEQLRRELAISWTGKEMPQWWRPAPINVTVAPNLQGGGQTVMNFDQQHHEVYGWRMSIQGSRQRVLDSVLPHEITHMVFASHFRTPVPRWADEGAAVSSEYDGERLKHRNMLLQFLRTQRGIPTSTLVSLKDYPSNPNMMLPFYAQSYALTEYLVKQGGRRKFLNFVGDGIRTDDWATAIRQHYQYEDLAQLQNQWVAWVGQGFPQLDTLPSSGTDTAIAASDPFSRPDSNPVAGTVIHDPAVRTASTASTAEPANAVAQDQPSAGQKSAGQSIYEPGWRAPVGLAASPRSSSEQSKGNSIYPLQPIPQRPSPETLAGQNRTSPSASTAPLAGRLSTRPIAGPESRIQFIPVNPDAPYQLPQQAAQPMRTPEAYSSSGSPSPNEPAREYSTQVARPMSPERPSTVILEWSRY